LGLVERTGILLDDSLNHAQGCRLRQQMYESFFHLQKNPFGMNPDPSCLFMTPSHREAFASLLYAVSRRKGFVVLTGDAGTGKTSLLRALIRSASDAKFSVIFTPRVSTDEFLELVLIDFGVADIPATKAQRIIKLQDVLLEMRLQGIAPVLVVDEAHTLSVETLEEIRLLTNFETAEEKLLQVVLAGQNDLAATLNRQDLRQLKQRIEIRMDLKPLAPADVGAYMAYRWSRAGGGETLPFSAEAVALIAKASRGIPRVINCICDNALLLAYAAESSAVTSIHVQNVLHDLDLGAMDSGFGNERKLTRRDRSEILLKNNETGASHPQLAMVTEEIETPGRRGSTVLRWADEMNLEPIPSRRAKP
jgi:general secretion pathway protein A